MIKGQIPVIYPLQENWEENMKGSSKSHDSQKVLYCEKPLPLTPQVPQFPSSEVTRVTSYLCILRDNSSTSLSPLFLHKWLILSQMVFHGLHFSPDSVYW